MAKVAFAQVLMMFLVLPDPHISMVAPQAITGMVISVWQVAILVEAGQIKLPEQEPIAKPLQVAVDLTTIGIMGAVLAEAQVPIAVGAVPQLQVPILQGIILPLAPVPNRPVEAVNGLIGEHVHVGQAVIPILAIPTPLLPEQPVPLEGRVHLDLIG